MAKSLRFHLVIARRRYTGSSATSDSADCRFGDMARPNGWTQLDQIWHAGGREGGREGREGGEGREGREGRGGEGRGGQGRAGEGRGGQGRAGQGRAGQGRAGQGRAGQGRAGQGRAGQGRGGDCPHFPQTRTFVTAEPSRPPAKRVTG